MKHHLGVCYYPEQWPENKWQGDAKGMAEAGITYVRIGEFAWNRIEPKPGQIELGWLINIMDILHAHGLKVVLGTPTAAPPRWLMNKIPDMVFVDAQGSVMRFGSRRHYCFSHMPYRQECARIVRSIAEGVKSHPALVAWQTDNEYGGNDTTLSYSAAARDGFRNWLKAKYSSIAALNEAWGSSFWSMAYDDFDEIDFPTFTPAQSAPTDRLDFCRYSSDQVVAFNKVQVDVIKEVTPDKPVCTNYMAMTTSFDHFAVGEDLDFASWDSYPLGYIEMREGLSDRKARYAQTGDPDMQAFQHDLSRSIGKCRFWIMEQQPGPVNWATYNNDPLPGMVRLWTWEAFSHGAEAVCYFRWRQVHFAQEQMHAGLLRPDSEPAPAFDEVKQMHSEMSEVHTAPKAGTADCAIIYDYESAWAWQIQPQARGFSHFDVAFSQYRQLRKLGLNVDIISSRTSDLSAYKVVFITTLFQWNDAIMKAIAKYEGHLVIGPRTGSKTENFSIPEGLPPGLPANLLDVKVIRVASLAPNTPIAIQGGGKVEKWFEKIETSAEVLLKTEDNWPLLVRQGSAYYLAGLLDDEGHRRVTTTIVASAGLQTLILPHGLRLRHSGNTTFIFNYGRETHDLKKLGFKGPYGLDGSISAPAGVSTILA